MRYIMLTEEQVKELCEETIEELTTVGVKEALKRAKEAGQEELERKYCVSEDEANAIIKNSYHIPEKFLPVLYGLKYNKEEKILTITLYPQGWAPLHK